MKITDQYCDLRPEPSLRRIHKLPKTESSSKEKIMNTLSNEARAIAYQTGVKALGPLVDRVIDLERAVTELQAAAETAAKQRQD